MKQGLGVMPNNFCSPFFLTTQFLLLLISLIGSNNITVSNNKKYPKGYMCLWDSYTITFNSIITPLFCENDLLIPVHLCEKVSAHIGYGGNFVTSTSLDIMWFLHPLICDMLKKPYIDKKTFFCVMPLFVIF